MNKNNSFSCLLLVCLLVITSQNGLNAQAFTEQTSAAGITCVHDGDTNLDLMSIGTGAAWFDYDNDGDQDLYITMRYTDNELYENVGSGMFNKVVGALGATDATGDGAGVAVADFNNDGWLDFYLANGNEDRLFLNDGGTAFLDTTATAAPDGFDMTDDSRGTSATWGDYDNDGYLDLYVAHHNQVSGSSNASSQDKLYYNNGDATFTNVSSLLPLGDIIGFGFIGAWTDFDLDGDLDIFLVNDCLAPASIPSKIFRNDGLDPSCTSPCNPKTDWVFTEVSVSEGVNDCRNGMGIAVGDYDRDAYMDIYYSNVGDAVLFNNGHTVDGLFRDSSSSAGVNGQAWPLFSWGTFFFDYDLDGWQDLFLILGSHHYESDVDANVHRNMLYHNNGDHSFTDVSTTMAMSDTTRGRTCIFGDYDNDGDPDVLLANFGEAVQLKRNENNNGNNYLWVDLEGTTSNRDGIGAKLKLTAADNSIQYFEMRSGSSLGGGDQLDAHFGLGTNTSALELEITWPSGVKQLIPNPPINTMLSITENLPLDIELSVFIAHLNEQNEVDLNWTTLSEENNQVFIIQKSLDGRSFKNIGAVAGQGTTEAISHYLFTDRHPHEGVNYYRLMQKDFDGSITYSEIRPIEFHSSTHVLKVFPNPLKNEMLQVVYTNQTNEFRVEVYDAVGAKVIQKVLTNEANGHLNFELDLSKLYSGIYFLIVEDGGDRLYKRIIKK